MQQGISPSQTLKQCLYSPCVQRYVVAFLGTLNISSVGSYIIVWTPKNRAHIRSALKGGMYRSAQAAGKLKMVTSTFCLLKKMGVYTMSIRREMQKKQRLMHWVQSEVTNIFPRGVYFTCPLPFIVIKGCLQFLVGECNGSIIYCSS